MRDDPQKSAWPAYLIAAVAFPFVIDPGIGLVFFGILLIAGFFALRAIASMLPFAVFIFGRPQERRTATAYMVQAASEVVEMHLHPPHRGASLAGGDGIVASGRFDGHGVFHARRVRIVRRAGEAAAASVDAGPAPSVRGPWLMAAATVGLAVLRVLFTG